MYNCRRALEDSQYLGIAKRANIVHLTPMTGGPFAVYPNKAQFAAKTIN